jgi:hypothetical protein
MTTQRFKLSKYRTLKTKFKAKPLESLDFLNKKISGMLARTSELLVSCIIHPGNKERNPPLLNSFINGEDG